MCWCHNINTIIFFCRDVWDQPFSWFYLDWKYLYYIGNLITRNTTFRRWKILGTFLWDTFSTCKIQKSLKKSAVNCNYNPVKTLCFTFLNTQRYMQPSAFSLEDEGNLKNIDTDCKLAKYCIHIPLEKPVLLPLKYKHYPASLFREISDLKKACYLSFTAPNTSMNNWKTEHLLLLMPYFAPRLFI